MDFSIIIQEILNSGFTQWQIAKECNTGQGHISDIYRKKRKRPNHELGEAILSLHKRVAKKAA